MRREIKDMICGHLASLDGVMDIRRTSEDIDICENGYDMSYLTVMLITDVSVEEYYRNHYSSDNNIDDMIINIKQFLKEELGICYMSSKCHINTSYSTCVEIHLTIYIDWSKNMNLDESTKKKLNICKKINENNVYLHASLVDTSDALRISYYKNPDHHIMTSKIGIMDVILKEIPNMKIINILGVENGVEIYVDISHIK